MVLFMLFEVFIIIWLLSNFVKEHDVISVIIIVIFYCVGIVGQAIIGDVFQVFRACSYLPFFLFGFKIRQHGSSGLLKIPVYIWIIADIILFFIVHWIAFIDNFVFKVLKHGGMFMLHLVGAVMVFVMLQKLAKIIHWKERKLFVFLSRRSSTMLERLRSNMESSIIKTLARSSESKGRMASLMIREERIVVKRIQLT